MSSQKGKLKGEWANILGLGQLKAKKKSDKHKTSKKFKCRFCSRVLTAEKARNCARKITTSLVTFHGAEIQTQLLKITKTGLINIV